MKAAFAASPNRASGKLEKTAGKPLAKIPTSSNKHLGPDELIEPSSGSAALRWKSKFGGGDMDGDE
jgi:hypothetical protein